MNIARIVLNCLLMISFQILCCQPGGKFCRVSQPTRRLGPDQHLRHKVDLWEIKKANKDQKIHSSALSGFSVARYEAYAKLLAQAIATQSTDDHTQCSARPIRCSHPLMAAALFTLLFIAPCAGNDYYEICDACCQKQYAIEQHIADQRAFIDAFHLDFNYPASDIHCRAYDQWKEIMHPVALGRHTFEWPWGGHWVIEDCHSQNNRAREFLTVLQQKDKELNAVIQEYNRRVDEHNKQAIDQFREKSRKIRQSCIDLRDEILYKKTRQELIKLWNLETKLRNGDYGESGKKMIEGLQFPADIVMLCPPVEENIDDLQLTREAQRYIELARQFIAEFEQTRQILQHRIDSQKIRENCIALKAKIEKIMPKIIALRNLENQLRNGDYGDLGKQVIGETHIPDDVQMVCPPANENLDDQQLTDEAQNSTARGEKFIAECEQKRQEIDSRLQAAQQPQPDQNLQIVTS